MRLRIVHADGARQERTFDLPLVRVGRNSACELAFDPAAYPKVSGLHAQIHRTTDGAALMHLSKSNKTLVNEAPIDGMATLRPGDRIRLGYSGPTIEVVSFDAPVTPPPRAVARPPGGPMPVAPKSADVAKPARAPKPDSTEMTAQADAADLMLLRGSKTTADFAVGRGGTIGRLPTAAYRLDHPLVSREHARLRVEGDKAEILDLRSANGTFVNGRQVHQSTALVPGDRLDIGPFCLEFDGETLVSRTRSDNIELVARHLSRAVTLADGSAKTLVDDVTLVVRPREFLAILGSSGSGKTSLLQMLSGRVSPDAGTVEINGDDLSSKFAALKEDIAVVHQNTALHESLTVQQTLTFTARLRLPPDTTRDEIDHEIESALAMTGLTEHRHTRIRELSGGQAKRAGLANELLSRPSLLFLDEATSGLDEETDREVMELFRRIADSGKTVVCVTHTLANVESTCSLVAFLAPGGRLAFLGSPTEAMEHFRVAKLGDVYATMARSEPDRWKAAYRASSCHARYVDERLAQAVRCVGTKDEADETSNGADLVRQTWCLAERYTAIWRNDPAALLVMFGQSLLVAVVLGIVFGNVSALSATEGAVRTVNLLLLLAVSSFWLGCNSAAKEIVKERVLFRRESDHNVRAETYLASKLGVLILVGIVQTFVLFAVVKIWCAPAGPWLGQFSVLLALMTAGTSLGLLLSAVAKTEEMAITLVPIVVIPQILLAGVIAPLSGFAKAIAIGCITVYWGTKAFDALLPEETILSLNIAESSFDSSLVVLVLHAIAFVLAARVVLKSRVGTKARPKIQDAGSAPVR
jgi:ABC transport system ATP-binding/permease protein